MASTVTLDALRELAAFRAVKGCAISLYVDLDPQLAINPGDIKARVNSLLDAGGRNGSFDTDSMTREQKVAFRDDLDRIRRYFADEFDRSGARGFALFCSSLDNLFQPLPLASEVADDVRTGRELYLAPLVPVVGRGEGALVAMIGRERGQLFRLRAGGLEEIADRTEDAPSQHDQGGWSQANYQRHIDEVVAQHIKRVLELIDRRLRREPSLRLVIVANDSVRGEVESRLSPEAQKAVVGWTTAEAHAEGPRLLEVVKPVLEHARAEDERKALERWREEASREGRAAAGWERTLEAASDGRVELLLVHANANHEAFQCPACGRGQLGNGNCPLDGTRLEKREDGLDLAVHQTLQHGGSIFVASASEELGPVEGIGALLRY
ncbi:MAG TPA: Vms1/Ankzf1 family peptidyl-tRNA hydrolase [Gaiellaceae bacterium]|nr:Vms1/Ankzf1 family peptidyl-tRNA hydrolase [Gaiellaceae bacterium]